MCYMMGCTVEFLYSLGTACANSCGVSRSSERTSESWILSAETSCTDCQMAKVVRGKMLMINCGTIKTLVCWKDIEGHAFRDTTTFQRRGKLRKVRILRSWQREGVIEASGRAWLYPLSEFQCTKTSTPHPVMTQLNGKILFLLSPPG